MTAMRLIKPLINTDIAYIVKDYQRLPHLRRYAVGTAIGVFKRNNAAEKAGQNDPLMLQLSDYTCDWLTETLIQGAYIREYHSWETEVKSFFNGQRHLNGELATFDWQTRSKLSSP